MPKKKSDKKIECFSASFDDILICQKTADRPYIEVFVEEPENIAQQNLGTLAGILEITDSSEDSSYIVNYLVSVIKKEYYSRPKRGTIESFEAALKKANLALAKLAEHETIGWIGHTNAILIIIDRNNLHLSQSGSARALLLRGKTLTDLSDGGADGTPNPIKTFTDIVSGRLEKDDKLIITTESMFDLFSLEEIKKSALKFSSTEFLRFLKTALVNELERAATLVIEVKKEEKVVNPEPVKNKESEEFNAFSQTSFAKKLPAKKPAADIPSESFYSGRAEDTIEISSERQAIVKEIKEELAKNKTEFIDKKTGHIYIKENNYPAEENHSLLETLDKWQEKLSDISLVMRDFGKSLGQKIKNIEAPKISSLKKALPSSEKRILSEEKPENSYRSGKEKHISVEAVPSETEIERVENRLIFYWKEYSPRIKRSSQEYLEKTIRASQRGILVTLRAARRAQIAIREFWLERQARKTQESARKIPQSRVETPSRPDEKKDWMKKYSDKLSGLSPQDPVYAAPEDKETNYDLKKFLPKFSRFSNILKNFDYTQKIYVALAIVLLFIVPYFLAKIGKKPATQNISVEQTAVAPALPLEKDKNVVHLEKIDPLYAGESISNVINLNGSTYAISVKGIIDINDGNAVYPMPENLLPQYSVGMNDLNLIFILGQDQRLAAWSPTNKAFQMNSISFPDNAKIAAMETYLTYLYILDEKSGQVWRYPRATGGFGDRSDWLKNPSDAANTNIMAVSDNIYLSGETNISKFFQGKKQDFTLEETATPIQIESLYAKRDYENLYILDKTNGRIIKTDQDGHILAQYENPGIKNATSLAADEETNSIYVASPNGVGKFEMK